MLIQSQCCTLEQAKKLKELGIIQASTFYYDFDRQDMLVYEGVNSDIWIAPHVASAFTVAELGVMMSEIDNGNIDATVFYNWHMGFWDAIITKQGDDVDPDLLMPNIEEDTEAEARAAMLVYLLENNLITAADCNTRLNSN